MILRKLVITISIRKTQNALDFPLPKAFRDASWFFDVLPGHYNGAKESTYQKQHR
ncbi:hypothetical protein ACVNPZ_15750 [Staphylococcus aureus]